MTDAPPAPSLLPSYELRSAAPTTLGDLDRAALDRYVARRAPALAEAPFEEAAFRLGLATTTGSKVFPTVLAAYVFGHAPQLLRPSWGVVAVRVDGTSLAQPVADRVDLEGPLPSLVEGALAFVRRHSMTGADGGPVEYPEAAVREAIVNALVHRELRAPGRPAVRLFRDRLEVWSPGGPALPSSAALDDLLDAGGVSLPRNPLVAAAARTLGLGEQLGRGLPMIRASVAEASGQAVDVRSSATDVLVVIPSATRGDVS